VVVGASTAAGLTVAALGANTRRFCEAAEQALLQSGAALRDPEALSTAVSSLRKLGRLDAALALHDRLVTAAAAVSAASASAVGDGVDARATAGEGMSGEVADGHPDGEDAADAPTTARRERFRLKFRSREDGFPLQLSYGQLLMESERRGDAALTAQLFVAMASEARSSCFRICVLNAAAFAWWRGGRRDRAEALLAEMASARLLNLVSQVLLQRLGLTESDLPPAAAGAAARWALRREHPSDMEKSHSKELSLLQAVLNLRTCDAKSVLAEIEEFGLKRQWIKVAGGEKAAVVDTVIAARKPRSVLEYGVYVGYTAMRMALRMAEWGGKVTSLEMDPVHACITRNIALLVGLEDNMVVQIGHSDDAVPILHEQGHSFDMVFMDQRSTRFHTDLWTLEELGMLQPSCVVVADNVLKPGAPRWLWHITRGQNYSSEVVSVREFGSAETEDWMTVTFVPGGGGGRTFVPPEPPGMAALTAKADRMRFRTVAKCMGDTRKELEDFNKELTHALAAMGIRKTKLVTTVYEGQQATSRVREVLDEAVWTDWQGEDPRMLIRGGQWRTDVSGGERVFPWAKGFT